MIVLGIDPDLHSTALALADERHVYAVATVQIDKKLKGEEAVADMARWLVTFGGPLSTFIDRAMRRGWAPSHVVVEGQQLKLHQSKNTRPEDLFRLAQVAGAALASALRECNLPAAYARCPAPGDWSQIEKRVRQARLYELYYKAQFGGYTLHTDWAEPVVKPLDIGAVMPIGLYKHVGDAIALAYWGATKGFK